MVVALAFLVLVHKMQMAAWQGYKLAEPVGTLLVQVALDKVEPQVLLAAELGKQVCFAYLKICHLKTIDNLPNFTHINKHNSDNNINNNRLTLLWHFLFFFLWQ